MARSNEDDDDLFVFSKALSEFESSQKVLDQKLKAGLSQLEANFGVLEQVAGAHRKQKSEYKALQDMLQEIKKKNMQEDSNLDGQIDAFRTRLAIIECSLDRMRAVKPRTGSLLLFLTLGRVNTKVWKKSELMQMKREYNKYKYRSTILFLLFALVQVVFDVHRFVGIIHQLWMLYFYLSLAIRENILLVNGSNIKSWWIYHHYLTMLVSMVTLLWPDGPDYQWFLKYFARYLTWQGIIMILQSHYQRRRHYVRTSLGKAKDIDPADTETLVEKPTDLAVLVPLLYLTYVYQISAGSLLMYQAVSTQNMWHMLCNGFLTLTLGVGNSVTTFRVLNKKRNVRNVLRKRSVS